LLEKSIKRRRKKLKKQRKKKISSFKIFERGSSEDISLCSELEAKQESKLNYQNYFEGENLLPKQTRQSAKCSFLEYK